MIPFRDWKKRTKWIAGLTLLLSLSLAAVACYSTWKVYSTAAAIYQPVVRLPSQPRLQSAQLHEERQDRLNIKAGMTHRGEDQPSTTSLLILGLDKRPDSTDIGRTDVIMLAILNGHSKKISLTSIPRDTYAEIAGQGSKDKINSAYRYGIETTIATVENFTGIMVDHYVLFNFDGFVKAIDSMGGLELDVDAQVAQYLHVTQGVRHLNGEQVLDFARFRKDGNGDFGRNDRQQKVIKAVLEQTRDLRSPAKIEEVFDSIRQDVRTDLDLSQIVSLASELRAYSREQVEQIKYTAHTARFGPHDLSYVVIDERERKRVSDLLKRTLSVH